MLVVTGWLCDNYKVNEKSHVLKLVSHIPELCMKYAWKAHDYEYQYTTTVCFKQPQPVSNSKDSLIDRSLSFKSSSSFKEPSGVVVSLDNGVRVSLLLRDVSDLWGPLDDDEFKSGFDDFNSVADLTTSVDDLATSVVDDDLKSVYDLTSSVTVVSEWTGDVGSMRLEGSSGDK